MSGRDGREDSQIAAIGITDHDRVGRDLVELGTGQAELNRGIGA